MIEIKFIENLESHAFEYIEECLGHKKEVMSGSGMVREIQDRHLPTVQYFLRIWLLQNKGKSIDRSTWYEWINLETSEDNTEEKNALIKLKSDTIKKIDGLFSALATDIVANEGKGIFYAKNKLGMTDKVQSDLTSKGNELKAVTITGMVITNETKEDEEGA